MKLLNYYKNKDIESEEEAFDFFMDNLQPAILDWDFFVDWDKVKEKVVDVENELNLLNGLIGKENTEEKYIDLLEKYPRIKKALSLLIAVRPGKLREKYIVDRDDKEDAEQTVTDWHVELKRDYFKVHEELDQKSKEELLKFYRDSGLKEVIEEKDIKNLVDYYFGLEVGMDTNARKNRTGNEMEKVVENYLSNQFNDYICQATQSKIEEKWGVKVDLGNIESNKAFDFAILGEEKNLYLIEVNYYSNSGSKLKSTAGEYRDYEQMINKKGANFIWITDGLGWKQHKNDLYDTFRANDYVFNLKMLSKGILKEVVQ